MSNNVQQVQVNGKAVDMKKDLSPAEQLKAAQALIAKLTADNEELKAKKGGFGIFRLKVSEKGALSVYGFGRFPITAYKKAWLAILDRADEMRQFIKDNDDKLKSEPTEEDKARNKAYWAQRKAEQDNK